MAKSFFYKGEMSKMLTNYFKFSSDKVFTS